MAASDELRTLFFLGFELDERLGDRLFALKSADRAPSEVLPLPLPLIADFDKAKLTAAFAGDAPFTVVPGGRQLKGKRPSAPEAAVARLAAALLPLVEHYPLPFFKLEG